MSLMAGKLAAVTALIALDGAGAAVLLSAPFVLPASASTILSCTPSNFAASLASLTIVELRGSRGDPLGRQPRTNSRWVRHLDSKPALRPRLRFHGVELGIAVQL